jgi:hypothetical protein
MASFSLLHRTLQCALGIAGSERKLARKLCVPSEALRKWLAGEEPLPTWAFLAAVDVIADGDSFRLRSPRGERRRFPRAVASVR